jgi:hypothetical protein
VGFGWGSMKVTGAGEVGRTGGSRAARGADGAGFRLPEADAGEGPSQSAAASQSAPVVGVEALIALQEMGGPLERRRRAVGRAGRILDVLDEVKLALIDGRLGAADLERLRRAVREQRAATGDPGLEGLLDEIETRAAVEIAKLESARAA